MRLKKKWQKRDVENSMTHSTKMPGSFREWFRVRFLSGHLKKTGKYHDVLDLCCGWGFYFKINPNAWGVDIDADCIEYLLQREHKVKQCNVIEALPFSDSAFDLVITHDALEHFSLVEVKKIFENVNRILRKDGKFMNIIPNRRGYEHGIRTDCGHKHFITSGELQDVAGKEFMVVKTYSYPLPRVIGQYFTHNKEVVIFRKIR